jgi:hypothetical protein
MIYYSNMEFRERFDRRKFLIRTARAAGVLSVATGVDAWSKMIGVNGPLGAIIDSVEMYSQDNLETHGNFVQKIFEPGKGDPISRRLRAGFQLYCSWKSVVNASKAIEVYNSEDSA